VLLDLAHIEQKSGQRPVELARDIYARLVGARARDPVPGDFELARRRVDVDLLGKTSFADAAFLL
jgi:hypothetical protein